MARFERLYVVQFSDDGDRWWVVWDDGDERRLPAAYETVDEAERRRVTMAEQFPEIGYRVVAFEYMPEPSVADSEIPGAGERRD